MGFQKINQNRQRLNVICFEIGKVNWVFFKVIEACKVRLGWIRVLITLQGHTGTRNTFFNYQPQCRRRIWIFSRKKIEIALFICKILKDKHWRKKWNLTLFLRRSTNGFEKTFSYPCWHPKLLIITCNSYAKTKLSNCRFFCNDRRCPCEAADIYPLYDKEIWSMSNAVIINYEHLTKCIYLLKYLKIKFVFLLFFLLKCKTSNYM